MPIRNLEKRLAALELTRDRAEAEPLRVIMSAVCGSPKLATSTCTRTRLASGQVLELVRLDGARSELRDAELDEFISNFPINELRERK